MEQKENSNGNLHENNTMHMYLPQVLPDNQMLIAPQYSLINDQINQWLYVA